METDKIIRKYDSMIAKFEKSGDIEIVNKLEESKANYLALCNQMKMMINGNLSSNNYNTVKCL